VVETHRLILLVCCPTDRPQQFQVLHFPLDWLQPEQEDQPQLNCINHLTFSSNIFFFFKDIDDHG
jgi:hypothetical protein